MKRSQQRAMEYFPGSFFIHDRCVFRMGYEQAEKDIISLIESRVGEILGDAQPRPALRAELSELIKKISNDNDR